MQKKSCAFIGHQSQSLSPHPNEADEFCSALKQELRTQIIRLIEDESVAHFISGMSLGVDLYAAEIVLDLKVAYPDITLESAIPCESQAETWSDEQRDRYFDIAARCDKETLLQTRYTWDCIEKRNRYMVNHANMLLAVWDGTSGETSSTVRYARRHGKTVLVIDPLTLAVACA